MRDILFSLDSYKHICTRHPDITDDDLMLMPDAVARGEIVGEYKRERWGVICYRHPANENVHYTMPFRAADHGHQIFVRTFHKMSKRQVAQLYKRAYPLRIHKG